MATPTTLEKAITILASMLLAALLGFLIVAIATSINSTRALTAAEIEAEAMATVRDATGWLPR